jgi:hypothetical protein
MNLSRKECCVTNAQIADTLDGGSCGRRMKLRRIIFGMTVLRISLFQNSQNIFPVNI